MHRLRLTTLLFISLTTAFVSILFSPGNWLNRLLATVVCTVFSINFTLCPVSFAQLSLQAVAANSPATEMAAPEATSSNLLAQVDATGQYCSVVYPNGGWQLFWHTSQDPCSFAKCEQSGCKIASRGSYFLTGYNQVSVTCPDYTRIFSGNGDDPLGKAFNAVAEPFKASCIFNVGDAYAQNPFSLGVNQQSTRSTAKYSSSLSITTVQRGQKYQITGSSVDQKRQYKAEILVKNSRAFLNSILLTENPGNGQKPKKYNIEIDSIGKKLSIKDTRGSLSIETKASQLSIRFHKIGGVNSTLEIPARSKLKNVENKRFDKSDTPACIDRIDEVTTKTLEPLFQGIEEVADWLKDKYLEFLKIIPNLNEAEKEKVGEESSEQIDKVKNFNDEIRKFVECKPQDNISKKPVEQVANQSQCTCTYAAEIYDSIYSRNLGVQGGFRAPCKANNQEVEAIIQRQVAPNRQSVLQGTVQRTNTPSGCGGHRPPIITSFICNGGQTCVVPYGKNTATLTFTYTDEDNDASSWEIDGIGGKISPPNGSGTISDLTGSLCSRGRDRCRSRDSSSTVTVTDSTGLRSAPVTIRFTLQGKN
ncbi:MAG: hypothetical protein KME52_26015 [Desmonostoc geniculatum HA4340-LM1]|nr:hypothetical protein [Desmonostoc geniculatum HA4340-LM1]